MNIMIAALRGIERYIVPMGTLSAGEIWFMVTFTILMPPIIITMKNSSQRMSVRARSTFLYFGGRIVSKISTEECFRPLINMLIPSVVDHTKANLDSSSLHGRGIFSTKRKIICSDDEMTITIKAVMAANLAMRTRKSLTAVRNFMGLTSIRNLLNPVCSRILMLQRYWI